MKLPPFAQIKLVAVLATASVLLGCEAPTTNAGEQTPDYPVVPVSASNLVAVTNLVAEEPALAPPGPEAPAAAPVALSARLQDVLKLAQSGVGDDVILAYIENSPDPFNPSPDEILYLTDVGLSDVVITALVNHRVAQSQTAQQAPLPPPQNEPAAPPTPEQAAPPAATYNPEPQVVYGAPPAVQSAPPAPPAEYSYFYNSLSPYGSWVDVPDYGYCWQPTVVVYQHDWRPYCDRGRWLYTDAGYYWQSDYSWGWAPFHYGRWFHHPARGWCWRPGATWSPAWVSWRYTDSHCGWAPLPPGAHYNAGVGFTYYGASVGVSFGFGLHHDAWTFVPANHFNDHEVWRHRVGGGERAALYQHSKVINNYTYNDNRIINRGVPSERLPALKRAEVRQVAIRDMPEGRSGVIRPDRLQQNGAQTVVYRPKLPDQVQRSMKAAENHDTRAVPSNPAAVSSPSIRSRSEPAPAGHSGDLLARTRQQPNTLEEARVAAPGPSSRAGAPQSDSFTETAPARSVPAVNPSTQRARPVTPQAVPQPNPVIRQEPANPGLAAPQRTPARSIATPQTYRAPAPQAVAPPTPAVRQELPNRTTSVAPEKYTRPAPSFEAPRSEPMPTVRNVPSAAPEYSAPIPSRPAPVYSPPAVQARPAPSFSLPQSRPAPAAPSYSPAPAPSRPVQAAPPVVQPASRPAPQAAPAPSQTSRSNNRRE